MSPRCLGRQSEIEAGFEAGAFRRAIDQVQQAWLHQVHGRGAHRGGGHGAKGGIALGSGGGASRRKRGKGGGGRLQSRASVTSRRDVTTPQSLNKLSAAGTATGRPPGGIRE